MSARPVLLELVPLPALRIRIPPLKTWKCCGCRAVYPEEVEVCELCDFSDSESEGYNEWYCRVCDDFCSNGGGLCRRCQ